MIHSPGDLMHAVVGTLLGAAFMLTVLAGAGLVGAAMSRLLRWLDS